MSEYDDRLDPSRYKGDEPVGVGPSQDGDEYAGWSWIPERLFERMQHIARAYELHVLPRLDPNGRTVLVRAQVEGLIGEAEFLSRIVADPALSAQLDLLGRAALSALSRGRGEFIVEGP